MNGWKLLAGIIRKISSCWLNQKGRKGLNDGSASIFLIRELFAILLTQKYLVGVFGSLGAF